MAFSLDDTIVAIATPPGRGGLGVVRLSGSAAPAIAAAILRRPPSEPRRATFTRVSADPEGPRGMRLSTEDAAQAVTARDEVIATYFQAPHSYTGEDIIEISAHGSPVILHAIVDAAMAAGARLAEPGEFTLRAFLRGKRDLVQAEAVADLVDAATPLQARVAFDQLDGTLTRRIGAIDATLFDLVARLEASLDFPDEGYHFIEPREVAAQIDEIIAALDLLGQDGRRGRLIREGATVVVAGRPNVGKSSLFNCLSGVDRAIVTPIPGTTRDLVTERLDLLGVAVTLVDTAGWRETLDVVEREGVARSAQARAVAGLVLLVLDRSEPLTGEDRALLEQTSGRPRVIALNKCDRPAAPEVSSLAGSSIAVSALTGEGLDDLRGAVVRSLAGCESLRDTPAISNARHLALLDEARDHLSRARAAAAGGTPEELLLTDLQAARAALDEIVGVRTSEDVLRHIFERFCIGK